MIHAQEKPYVSNDGDAGPYVMVPVEKLTLYCAALDNAKIAYWIDADAISLNGKPVEAIINFAQECDLVKIREILDQIPA